MEAIIIASCGRTSWLFLRLFACVWQDWYNFCFCEVIEGSLLCGQDF
jgi:hypothetical protein